MPLLLDSSSSSSSPAAADQKQTPPPPPPAFGFFNGLGADRRVCYDVYARVVEMHLGDAGLDVEWRDLDVDLNAGAGLDRDGEGEWRGVRRRYWTLDSALFSFLFLFVPPPPSSSFTVAALRRLR